MREMPVLLFPSVEVLAGHTLAGDDVDTDAVQAYFEAMSPEDLERFAFYLNQHLDEQPMGARIKALATSRRLGLGIVGALTTALTGLATTALSVGVDLYDKKKDRQAAASADKRAYAAEAAKVQALAKKAVAQTKVTTTTYGKYALYGALGVAVISLVGLVAWRRS